MTLVERRINAIPNDTWASDSLASNLNTHNIIHEGWLEKRGEFWKNWRKRYFLLFSDGTLQGFKENPKGVFKNPMNDFHVKSCQILKTEEPKPNTFILRGLDSNTVIERTFNAPSYSEREQWIENIEEVREKLRDSTTTASLAAINNTRKTTLNDFETLKVIGKGTFGKVIMCRHKDNQKLYAIKMVRKDVIASRSKVRHTVTENKVLQKIAHPFLIHAKCAFTTADRFCFVLEYVNGGELFFHLRKSKTFDEKRVRFYASEICLAIGYLHEKDIIYRDLKLENILLDANGHIKITDLGLCKENIQYESVTSTFCGTPEYLPPEVLKGQGYGRSVDWWAYGVCIYEMIVGYLPFYNKRHAVLYDLICDSQPWFPSIAKNSYEVVNLMKSFLTKDPKQRLGGGPDDAKDVMKHPFFHNVDWNMVYNKEIPPPFLPEVRSETDTKYIDVEFTKEHVDLTPIEDSHLKRLQEQVGETGETGSFGNFSYEANSSTLGDSISYLTNGSIIPR